jgi:hypothetical protein
VRGSPPTKLTVMAARELLRCGDCGTPVLEDVTPDEVVTVGGLSVLFRRHTDFVLCPSCAATYPVVALRGGQVRLVGEKELVRSSADLGHS